VPTGSQPVPGLHQRNTERDPLVGCRCSGGWDEPERGGVPIASFCIAVGENYSNLAQAWSWNGTAWTDQATYLHRAPSSVLYAIECAGASSCEAVGSYSDANYLSTGRILERHDLERPVHTRSADWEPVRRVLRDRGGTARQPGL